MKIVDVNVLLYAINPRQRMHGPAREWLDQALIGASAVGFSWLVILGFLRVSTLQQAFPNPLTIRQAAAVMEAWLGQRSAVLVEPTPRHLFIVRGLLEPLELSGDLVPDAHLAALAIEHDGEVVSFDTDFARFPGVRWHHPVARSS